MIRLKLRNGSWTPGMRPSEQPELLSRSSHSAQRYADAGPRFAVTPPCSQFESMWPQSFEARTHHFQASAWIGSPTLPKTRRLERSKEAMSSVPKRMRARMAVGAV